MPKKRREPAVQEGYFRCRRCRALIAVELAKIHAANHAKNPVRARKPKRKRALVGQRKTSVLRDDESTSVKTVSGGLPGLGRRSR